MLPSIDNADVFLMVLWAKTQIFIRKYVFEKLGVSGNTYFVW